MRFIFCLFINSLCSYLYRLAKCPRAMSVAFSTQSVHGTVSPLTNRFLYVTGIWTLGFGHRRYGRLFLAIAGLFVITS